MKKSIGIVASILCGVGVVAVALRNKREMNNNEERIIDQGNEFFEVPLENEEE